MKAPAVRYHGSKFRLAPWVISHFPRHDYYIEPFGGAAGVLLQKPRCHGEVYNDLDGDIVNFFEVVRDPVLGPKLERACRLTPFSRAEFNLAYLATDDPLERARRLIVRATMGFGSGGATLGHTGFRNDVRRLRSNSVDVWLKYPDTLAAVGSRFTGVLIENKPAVEVIQKQDHPDALIYVDPPYMHDTRVMGGRARAYKHELTDSDHNELLSTLRDCKGMVIVSGYPSSFYDEGLKGWKQVSTKSRISAGRVTSTRTEVLWINPAAAKKQSQLTLDV
ncbi:DNA adenine methylase [Aliidiomarina sp. Khilg15.8]